MPSSVIRTLPVVSNDGVISDLGNRRAQLDHPIPDRLPDSSSQATVLDLGAIPFTEVGSGDEHVDRDRDAIERLSPLSRKGCVPAYESDAEHGHR
jgi:hypothetical protein